MSDDRNERSDRREGRQPSNFDDDHWHRCSTERLLMLIATPIVGYLLGPIRRNGGYNSWIDLGDAWSICPRPNAPGQLCQSA